MNNNTTNATALTEASEKLFLILAKDSGNWGHHPYIGANFNFTREMRGNLTQLKQAGLLTTQHDEDTGMPFVIWTRAGVEKATSLGITICED